MEISTQLLIDVLALPSLTALGCVTAYVYSEQKEIQSSLRFLRNFFPGRHEAFYFRADFFMTAVVGTCIGLILYEPRNAYQALAAGVGWTAAYSIAKKEKEGRTATKAKPSSIGQSEDKEQDQEQEK